MADNEVLEELQSRVTELELMMDELLDEAEYKIKLRREYKRHRDILEGLLVEAFGLSGPDALRINHKSVARRSEARVRVINPDRDPARVAVMIAYYILWQHNIYATRKQLRTDYGYETRRFQDIFPRIELIHQNRIKRLDIERKFLDAIGRPDEPVTELSHQSIARAAWKKRSCRETGKEYRRSEVD